jgi:hypothetical protein
MTDFLYQVPRKSDNSLVTVTDSRTGTLSLHEALFYFTRNSSKHEFAEINSLLRPFL